jgi:DNA-binding NtrC family response regulator
LITDGIDFLKPLAFYKHRESRRSRRSFNSAQAVITLLATHPFGAVFAKDRELNYVYVSPALAELLNLPESKILDRSDNELFSQEEKYERMIMPILYEERYVAKHGETNKITGLPPFMSIMTPLYDPSGRFDEYWGVLFDPRTYAKHRPNSDLALSSLASGPMQLAIEQAALVAKTDSIVLLGGESGSGKDYLARYIHDNSKRAGGPYFTVNCAAVSEDLAESELFGHEAGAFTGARNRKKGLLELAEGGTLLLNELGELSPRLQAKLLTFLDTRTFTRVGGEKPVEVNARLIAATNRDLNIEVRAGRFRSDLLFRFSVFTISLPPLRERKNEIPVLFEKFLEDLRLQMGLKSEPQVAMGVIENLQSYAWPGNVRELRNVLEQALIKSEGKIITVELLGLEAHAQPPREPLSDQGLQTAVERFHRLTFEEQVRHLAAMVREECGNTSGSVKSVACVLGRSDRWVRNILAQTDAGPRKRGTVSEADRARMESKIKDYLVHTFGV